MNYVIKLFNGDCQLDAVTVYASEGSEHEDDLNYQIKKVIADWVIRVGDVIKVEDIR